MPLGFYFWYLCLMNTERPRSSTRNLLYRNRQNDSKTIKARARSKWFLTVWPKSKYQRQLSLVLKTLAFSIRFYVFFCNNFDSVLSRFDCSRCNKHFHSSNETNMFETFFITFFFQIFFSNFFSNFFPIFLFQIFNNTFFKTPLSYPTMFVIIERVPATSFAITVASDSKSYLVHAIVLSRSLITRLRRAVWIILIENLKTRWNWLYCFWWNQLTFLWISKVSVYWELLPIR